MESFAVLRACQTCGIPLIGLGGISDGTSALHDDNRAALLGHLDPEPAGTIDRLLGRASKA